MTLLPIIARGMFDSVSRSASRGGTLSDNLFLITWIGLIIAFWIGLYYFDQWRKSRSAMMGSAKSLFVELCKAHRLTRTERALMLRAAKVYNPAEPAAIFVDPRILSSCATLPKPDGPDYSLLRQKIFGEFSSGA